MTMVFLCDVCSGTLDRREVVDVELSHGAVLIGERMQSKFVPDKQPVEYMLCAPCADYLRRCLQHLRAPALIAEEHRVGLEGTR